MSETPMETAAAPVASGSGGRSRRTPKDGPKVSGGSRPARQVAAAVLEVLAGVIRPAEAAEALKVSLPRYYTLERRALEGLVLGCEPVPVGRKASSPQKELDQLQRQVARLEQDSARYQALARASQRAVGLSIPKRKDKPVKGRRRRTPAVRALKVAQSLKGKEVTASEPEDGRERE